MKIAIDVSQVVFGTGVSVYTRNLVHHLTEIVDSNHQLVLFGGSLRRKAELDLWINRLSKTTNKTNRLPPQFVSFLWNNLHLFPAEIFTGPVDVIHTSDWAEPPSRTPKITTVHDLSFFKDSTYVQSSVRATHIKRLYWVAKESRRIIAVSQATKNDLIKYLDIDPQRIDVIYEGPSVAKPPTLSPLTQEKILSRFHLTKPFLFVPGCGHPRKNIPNLVKAFLHTKLDYQLLIVGRPTPQERTLASSQIIFTGYLSDPDWAELMTLSEALLYPSLYEGFGIPILDAFVCNTPVVTSKTSSMPEVSGSAAILVDPHSIDSISTGIIKALDSKISLIKAGQERLQKFSWSDTAKQTLKLYQQIA